MNGTSTKSPSQAAMDAVTYIDPSAKNLGLWKSMLNPFEGILASPFQSALEQQAAWAKSVAPGIFGLDGPDFQNPFASMLNGLSESVLEQYAEPAKSVDPAILSPSWALDARAKISKNWIARVEELDLTVTDIDEEFHAFAELYERDIDELYDERLDVLEGNPELRSQLALLWVLAWGRDCCLLDKE